ncbi:MAG: hypothetical protein LBO07_04395, partial [Coriobacteriales bacterium]|nr:hypothetical protein [Coriobacteriales bacterium]
MAHLEEKYPGHTFEIVQYQGPGLPGTNPVVEMYCRPDGADFVFNVWIRLSSGEIRDAYASAYNSKKANDYVVASFEARGVRAAATMGAFAASQDDLYHGPPIEDVHAYLDTIGSPLVAGSLLIDESSI